MEQCLMHDSPQEVKQGDQPDPDGLCPSLETATVEQQSQEHRVNNSEAAPDSGHLRWTLLWHARWTIPLHILLPIGLSWLIRNDPATATSAFLGVHAGFPFLLLVTAPWWWSRKDELLALLLINHVVSFVVLMFVPW